MHLQLHTDPSPQNKSLLSPLKAQIALHSIRRLATPPLSTKQIPFIAFKDAHRSSQHPKPINLSPSSSKTDRAHALSPSHSYFLAKYPLKINFQELCDLSQFKARIAIHGIRNPAFASLSLLRTNYPFRHPEHPTASSAAIYRQNRTDRHSWHPKPRHSWHPSFHRIRNLVFTLLSRSSTNLPFSHPEHPEPPQQRFIARAARIAIHGIRNLAIHGIRALAIHGIRDPAIHGIRASIASETSFLHSSPASARTIPFFIPNIPSLRSSDSSPEPHGSPFMASETSLPHPWHPQHEIFIFRRRASTIMQGYEGL